MAFKFASRTAEDVCQTILYEFFLQLALGNEWNRVLIDEKRVGLGIFVSFLYCVALISTVITANLIDKTTSILFVPSLLAALISVWMNIAIFWNRLAVKRRNPAINTVNTAKRRFVASWPQESMNRPA